MKTRLERDYLGTIRVPLNAYYGSFTARAHENFQISGLTMPKEFRQALGMVKMTGVETNLQLGLIDKKYASAIKKAAKEFINGKFDNEFCIDCYQAGAGTPFNMNANEIIANRANEILKGKKGEYLYVHPNNHINMAQSSNDVIPTAGRIATLLNMPPLLREIEKLSGEFQRIGKKTGDLIKVGRTHLEDAVPMKVSQEYHAFTTTMKKNLKRIKEDFSELNELGIGGNAIGSGINTHPNYRKTMVKNLSKLTRLKLKPASDCFELTQSMSAFVRASNALRICAIDLIKIANDLKLLNMGPKAGIHEITLPEVQPGSSIMPGKVNPSIPECVHQIGYQVMGYDHTIAMCAQAGQLQLNVMGPLVILNILWSIKLLTNGIKMFNEKCVSGIRINAEEIKRLFDNSLSIATALNPFIGYEVTSALVKEALKKNKTIVEMVKEKKLIDEPDLKIILSPLGMTQPRKIDQNLVKKIKKNPNYIKFKKQIS